MSSQFSSILLGSFSDLKYLLMLRLSSRVRTDAERFNLAPSGVSLALGQRGGNELEGTSASSGLDVGNWKVSWVISGYSYSP